MRNKTDGSGSQANQLPFFPTTTMKERPKYSVIIPSRNGCKYLSYAIRSVLEQGSEDFELIVSDNHSGDDTWHFLSTLSDPRLRTFQPPEPLSMARHFEFAISKARGEWITVLGDDDGLQPYFFDLAEKMTLASPDPVISSPRAYYFWPGCEVFYLDSVVQYAATRKTSTRHSLTQLLRLLFYPGFYFEEPQFYTGTLFRRDFYEGIRDLQGGTVFKTTIVDANSVALIFKHARQYTYCQTPLTWIGSSPKSNGFAQTVVAQSGTAQGDGESKKLVNDFDSLNLKDSVPTNSRFPFSAYIHNVDAYFLEAFFQVHSKSGTAWGMILKLKPALYLLFGKIYREYEKQTSSGMREAYEKTFAANGLNLLVLKGTSRLITLIFNVEEPHDQNPSFDCNFSSNSRSEFPTILHASAKSKDLYEQKLS